VDRASFHGLALLSAPGKVMTPRSASEQLVATAARRIGDRSARVADVGTGSGAIAVAVALAAPRAEVWASDLSPAAVLLARANAHRFGVADRLQIVHGDLLTPLPDELDLIVANLPYLPLADRDRHPDVAEEPEDAVFAAGDGLDPYRRLLEGAEEKLVPGGAVAIQLHRHVFVAEREQLPAMRSTLPKLVPSLRAVA
jgi:release factor glutamine methyltransferase